MDMSAAYWAAVAENLPHAAIVFDRFHITQLVNQKLDDLRREMVREATGLMSRPSKRSATLLLMRRRQRRSGETAPGSHEPSSITSLVHQAICSRKPWDCFGEQPSYAKMNAFLHEWCELAAQSGIRQMMQLAKTFLSHKSGILSWWKHRIKNGRMEGINNKIKTLLRQTTGCVTSATSSSNNIASTIPDRNFSDEAFLFIKGQTTGAGRPSGAWSTSARFEPNEF